MSDSPNSRDFVLSARHGGRSALASTLLDALHEDRIALAYQPVVRRGDSGLAYYETLLRVLGEESGPFEAEVFVPVAEQLGHAGQIDRRVLELAVADLERHPGEALAINVSGHTTADRAWLRLCGEIVGSQPEVARRLIVEITETAEILDLDQAAGFVAAIQAMGCRVALDDFGSGFTSFRQLWALPVDIVKIDGSYVRGIAENIENQAFVDRLLDETRPFGVETVAECVEAAADRDYLLHRDVTYLQGWMFGKPELDRLGEGGKTGTPAAG